MVAPSPPLPPCAPDPPLYILYTQTMLQKRTRERERESELAREARGCRSCATRHGTRDRVAEAAAAASEMHDAQLKKRRRREGRKKL